MMKQDLFSDSLGISDTNCSLDEKEHCTDMGAHLTQACSHNTQQEPSQR